MNAMNQSCSSMSMGSLENSRNLPSLELNTFLVPKPASSVFVKAVGDLMSRAGILHGDLLVVDRAKEPKSGNLVALETAEGLTICRMLDDGLSNLFQQEGEDGLCVLVSVDESPKVFGVVTWVLHQA